MSQHSIHIPTIKGGGDVVKATLILFSPAIFIAVILMIAAYLHPYPLGWLCPGFKGVVVSHSNGPKGRGTPRLDGIEVSDEEYGACELVELPHNGAGE